MSNENYLICEKVILDLCGGSGAWSKPYMNNGFTVLNITLPQYDVRKYFLTKNAISFDDKEWILFKSIYGILAAPPCTYFSRARTRAITPRLLPESMEIVQACLNIIWECQYRIESDFQQKPPLKFWALENPLGMLNWFLGHPVFKFHPFEFGDGYTKLTCLWGHFNKPKKSVHFARTYQRSFEHLLLGEIKKIRSMSDITMRHDLRAVTPPGFAEAFYQANHG